MGQGWRRVSRLRTYCCQGPAERILICAGTQVKALGGGRTWEGSIGRSCNGAVGLEVQKSTRENRTGLYFVLFVHRYMYLNTHYRLIDGSEVRAGA